VVILPPHSCADLVAVFTQNFSEEIARLELDMSRTSDDAYRASIGSKSMSVDGPATSLAPAGMHGLLLDQNPSHTYALDANSRLQRRPYEPEGHSLQSPLQRHICAYTRSTVAAPMLTLASAASLSKQPQPMRKQLSDAAQANGVEQSRTAAGESGIGGAPIQSLPSGGLDAGASDSLLAPRSAAGAPSSGASRYEASILTENGTAQPQPALQRQPSRFSRLLGKSAKR